MFESVEVAHDPADLVVAGELLAALERVPVTVDPEWADLVDDADGPAGADDDDPAFEWPDDPDWLVEVPSLGELFAADEALDLVESVQPAAQIDDLDDDGVLQRLAAGQRRINLDQAEQLILAARWADLHAALDLPQLPGRRGGETMVRPGGEGTPKVAEFCRVELAAILGISQTTAGNLIADALDLRHRLPELWSRVQTGDVKIWVARKITTRTRRLTRQAAARVDRKVAPIVDTVPFGRLEKILDAAILAADPDQGKTDTERAAASQGVWLGRDIDHGYGTIFGKAAMPDLRAVDTSLDSLARALTVLGDTDPIDLRRAKALGILADPTAALELTRLATEALAGSQSTDRTTPSRRTDGTDPRRRCDLGRAVLYVHVTQQTLTDAVTGTPGSDPGVARVEDVGPVPLDQVRDWLGHRQVKLTKVIDLPGMPPVDRYEVPDARTTTDRQPHRRPSQPAAAPYSGPCVTSRNGQSDHTRRYVPMNKGGPPGQTNLGNLGCLPSPRTGNSTTSKGDRQPLRNEASPSPHGYGFLVDEHGTHALGRL